MSLRDLCDSVFPIRVSNPCFLIRVSMQDELHLDGLRSGEKSKFKLGLNTIRRI